MPYSSYSNYLEYKNCKRQTLPCYNNFNSYQKYNRSLTCNRAWWTNQIILDKPASAKGMTIQQYIMTKPCKSGKDIPCDNKIKASKFDVNIKCYCSNLKKCCGN